MRGQATREFLGMTRIPIIPRMTIKLGTVSPEVEILVVEEGIVAERVVVDQETGETTMDE